MWRRDRVPTLTVQADVAPGSAARGRGLPALSPAVEKLSASLPASYHIAVGGTVEESQNSQASVMAVVPLMLFLMVTFLMIQLQSFNLLFIVLSVVPMGLIGIVASLLLFNRPLGFVAILGILALLGMIARNAVILIEQIEAEKAQGLEYMGCRRRGEPLALPSHHADGGLDGSRADSDRRHHLLGPDGLRHHGRLAGRHGADADLPAGAVCDVVPGPGTRQSRAGTGFR